MHAYRVVRCVVEERAREVVRDRVVVHETRERKRRALRIEVAAVVEELERADTAIRSSHEHGAERRACEAVTNDDARAGRLVLAGRHRFDRHEVVVQTRRARESEIERRVEHARVAIQQALRRFERERGKELFWRHARVTAERALEVKRAEPDACGHRFERRLFVHVLREKADRFGDPVVIHIHGFSHHTGMESSRPPGTCFSRECAEGGDAIQPSRLMRARINERLARAADYPVTLIVAPAGFGKTVALRDFLDTSRSEAVRYDVRREDRTMLAFARGLAEALGSFAPGLAASFPAMQERVAAAADATEEVAAWFAEHVKRVVASIAIDDLHNAAGDPATVALLVELIERTQGRVSWIVASRSDAGLPVASWLGYGRIDVPIGEDDLRFTTEEALAISAETESGVDARETEALRELTEGWPIALAIALRTRTHVRDLPSAALGTREMVYRYLAEQVFAGLNPPQRDLLLRMAVFESFTTATVEALGASAGDLAELRRTVTFVTESSPGVFKYHDLFREFLEAELRRAGDEPWRRAHREGGAIHERSGDDAAALRLYLRAAEIDAGLAVLARSGFRLFERGEVDLIDAFLNGIRDDARASEPIALGLRAVAAASRGHVEIAERDFAAAIERASGALRVELVHRCALELVRRSRDAVGLLETYAFDGEISAQLRVPLMGTLATAYARNGRVKEALATIERAMSSVDETVDEDRRARFYQQAAFVHQTLPDRGQSWAYANAAIDLALKRGLYDVAARAYSIQYAIVYDDRDDPIEALRLLDRLIECAKKSANRQTLAFGLICQFDLEVDRANDAAIERIEAELNGAHALLPDLEAATYLPARAVIATWGGDFETAYQTLSASSPRAAATPDWRAAQYAQLALYAFSAGRAADGEAALQISHEALEACADGARRVTWARVMLALAELVRGHHATAHRLITEAERALTPARRRLRAVVAAARTLYRVVLQQEEAPSLAAALERLRAEHLGGLARVLEQLAVARPEGEHGGYGLLTAAEREILAMLARGTSTKDIAGRTGRSPHTVDTHIRSICRKLRCNGRREAVAVAIQGGWVQP